MPRGVYKRKGPKKAAANKEKYNLVTSESPNGYVSEDTYSQLSEQHRLALLELAETRVEFLRLQLELSMKERDELIAKGKR
jgi:hypothetical protein